MGHHSVGQVCLNGHEVTGDYQGNPELCKDFCGACGEATIAVCPECKKPIRGYFFETDRLSDERMVRIPPFNAENYCHGCGKEFPWTLRYIDSAQELADEIDELTEDEKKKLKISIADITRDTSKTELAATRMKKYLVKANPIVRKSLTDIVVPIATDAAKKYLGI